MNQRSHEGSSGPGDGVAGTRQGTHLEKRVRYSGPGVTRGVERLSFAAAIELAVVPYGAFI